MINKKDKKLTLVRTTILSLSDLRTVSGGATFDCYVKMSGGCEPPPRQTTG